MQFKKVYSKGGASILTKFATARFPLSIVCCGRKEVTGSCGMSPNKA